MKPHKGINRLCLKKKNNSVYDDIGTWPMFYDIATREQVRFPRVETNTSLAQ